MEKSYNSYPAQNKYTTAITTNLFKVSGLCYSDTRGYKWTRNLAKLPWNTKEIGKKKGRDSYKVVEVIRNLNSAQINCGKSSQKSYAEKKICKTTLQSIKCIQTTIWG